MSNDFLASPPKKKLPFKLRRIPQPKPTLAVEGEQSEDDGLDLFRRSKEMAPIIAADRERRLGRHQQKQREQELEAEKRKTGRRDSGEKRPLDDGDEDDVVDAKDKAHSDDVEVQGTRLDHSETLDEPATQSSDEHASELVTPPPSKRSRLDLLSKRIDESAKRNDDALQTSPSARRLRSHRGPKSPVRQPNLQKQSETPAKAPAIISIDSDSDDAEDAKPATATPSRSRSRSLEMLEGGSPAPSSPQADAEEDEFAEYVRKFERRQEKDQALLRSGLDGSPSKENTEIYVSSVIPGSHAVVVKFLFDKPLRIVRETWLAIQKRKGLHIAEDQEEDVVLTWRRKKVYNYSTLFSLGIRPQAGGRLVADTHDRAGFSESRQRVHFEAWTPDLFQKMEHEEDLRRRREAGELSDDEDEAASPESSVPEVKVRVILKSLELEDVKLGVRLETTVETLITGFRTQRSVPASKEISLWFDGERLEEHMTMEDAEIDDMDTIEAHIK